MHRLARLWKFAAILMALGVPLASRGAAHPPAILNEAGEKLVAQEVAAFRRELAAAIARRDTARVRRMYAPVFRHTDQAGVITGRDDRLAILLARDASIGAHIETAPVEDLAIRVPNDWVAIATGRASIRTDGDAATTQVRWTTVYTRSGQSWVVAASHVSRVPASLR